MNSSDISKPWQYKNKWMVWPETTLDSIIISDCDSTINGICLSGKTINQCIDECKEGCSAGYHMQFENGTTLCAPLLTNNRPHLNPVHRLRRKEIYPELKNVKISTFVNTDYFPFPPEEGNVVFFLDILTISDKMNEMYITLKNKQSGDDLIYLDKNTENNLQFIDALITAGQVERYMPLRYGQPCHIATPATSLLISVSSKNTLEWKESSTLFSTENTIFELIPIDSTKKIGDLVTYNDVFGIRHGTSLVIANINYPYLHLSSNNLDKISNNKDLIYKFTLSSKMIGYYCDGRNCKEVPIKDIETVGTSGLYKGVTVGRNQNCWGVCKYLVLGTNSTIPLKNAPDQHNDQDNIMSSTRHSYLKNFLIIILGMIIIIILSIIILKLR
jgi:hypothetical protein